MARLLWLCFAAELGPSPLSIGAGAAASLMVKAMAEQIPICFFLHIQTCIELIDSYNSKRECSN
jgi:hypothetical protein